MAVTIPTGTEVSIPYGTYTIRIDPAINGQRDWQILHRMETVTVDSSFTGEFEWQTKTVPILIHDQFGAEISGSTICVPLGNYIIDTGSQAVLPLTDDAVYPTIGGTYASGVDFWVRPGINGQSWQESLHRRDSVEIDGSFTGEFEWQTKAVAILIHDQGGVEIPGSTVRVPLGNYVVSTGAEAVLPITDEGMYPTMGGAYVDGVDIWIRPGINGQSNPEYLKRLETLEIDLNSSGAFEWITVSGPLYVVDGTGVQEVAGSSYNAGLLGAHQSGDYVVVPVTDDGLYPSIAGDYSDGYDIAVYPGDQPGVEGQFPFEFYADYSIMPEFVDINGSLYGLRFEVNGPPQVEAGGPYNGDEGSPISLDGAVASDPDDDALTSTWEVDSALCSFSDPSAFNPDLTCADNGSFVATLTVSDGVNEPVSSDATVTVANVAPTIESITALIDPVSIHDQPVGVGVAFSDPGTADTHDVTWEWDDGTSSDIQYGATSPATQDHTYAEAGVYRITVTVTDDDGGWDSDVHEFIVIYDPEGGFVTGGGWIDSPGGAYAPDPTLTGKATFGFVSKYKKGANVPTGQTQFQFKMADLNFHSDTYQWLVVAGAKAKFKGTGTINGQGNYGFMLSAVDEKLTPSTDVDLFRIKIWDKDNGDAIVYDNQMGDDDDGDATTAIGGGSIVIHKK